MSPRPALLLAAFPPELGDLGRQVPPGWRVGCTGVGAVTAAVATAGLLTALTPSRVLFVGTCGAYDDRLRVGDFLTASDALAVALDVLEGRAYRPPIEVIRWPSTQPTPGPFPVHTVAVPPGITQTRAGALRLASLAAAEHLELTGVFAACQAAGIPCSAALAVANRVGPEAHEEWRANHERVSQALLDALTACGTFQ